MKNKEKYAKEILNIALEHDAVAVTRKDGIVMGCSQMEYCEDCLFLNSPVRTCKEEFKKWADSEYGKRFTDREIEFIKLFPEIKYLARDESGKLAAFSTKPIKYTNDAWWVCESGDDFLIEISSKNLLKFSDIKWKDKEPTSREEILGESEDE